MAITEVISGGTSNPPKNLLGLSSDTKPTTGIAAGSKFYETDTGKLFIYGSDWTEVI